MKALSLSILFALTFAAQAGVGSSTPSDLTQYWNPKYTILNKTTMKEGIPNKGVQTKYGIVYTKLQNLCQEGNKIKTLQPVRVCAEWGYKVVRCKSGANEGKRECFDRDERVCKAFAKVMGQGSIQAEKLTCAKIYDKEAREWRRKFGNSDKKFKTDFPNCSVFKTFTSKMVLTHDFYIVSNLLSGSEYEERRFGGPVVEELTYTVPACSSL